MPGRIIRGLLAVAVAAAVLVALHEGLVAAAARGGGDRSGGLARFAAGTCAACHAGGPASPAAR